jgi:hypothetical protein
MRYPRITGFHPEHLALPAIGIGEAELLSGAHVGDDAVAGPFGDQPAAKFPERLLVGRVERDVVMAAPGELRQSTPGYLGSL